VFRIGVRYQIEPRWHIYWKNPGDAGISTKITWRLPEGFTAGNLQWPAPMIEKEPGELQVFSYSNEVLLFAEVHAPEKLPAGPLNFGANSNWLVCERICVPGKADMSLELPSGNGEASLTASLFESFEKKVPFRLPKEIHLSYSRVGKDLQIHFPAQLAGSQFLPLPPEDVVIGHVVSHPGYFSVPIESEQKPMLGLDGILISGTGTGQQAYEIAAASVESTGQSLDAGPINWSGFSQALFFALIGGLILNVMPCVLPVISLKVFGFVKDSGRQNAFRLSLAFASGIMVCFAVLAVLVILIRAAGVQVGWGFQFQDSRFVLFIACLVFAFALNMFGVYEISVSPRSTGKLASLAKGRGAGGAFFQGVFATVLATPCTAPFLGTASAFAFAQPSWITFTIFIFIGLGMSLPYLLLALNPAWVRFLPKPGSWMLYLKQGMGFLLLATLLWLVWVLGQMKGVNSVVLLGALLLVIAILAWIKGSFWTPISSSRSRIAAVVAMLAVLGFSAAIYSFLTKPTQLAWRPFSEERLDLALASGHPVFIDFTADWCITCKTNERFAIDTAEVRQAFEKNGVVILKADWTNGDPAITDLLKQHGRAGVPMYLVYPGGGGQDPVLLPELITSQTVLDALNRSRQSLAEIKS
ncbi:MAG: thioredoxin family protein, partial [Verrucomicrobia bacterium]|nr:thioredoxin family protein [Verrucomicrobiota bacterium]